MSVHKVFIGDRLVIDLSQDTVTENDVLIGVTFHLPNGDVVEGKLDLSNFIDKDSVQTMSNKTISASDNNLVGVALEKNNIQISGVADDGTSFDYTMIIKNNS